MAESLFECMKRNKLLDFDKKLLNEEFKATFNLIESSSDCFFITGKAGTGKSTLLRYFKNHSKKNIVVLAPTGLAALNVGGQTIHSFFRFPPAFIESKHIKYVDSKVYKKLDAIVIDEISMVRADLLDGIDKFMRKNGKDKNKPFGGVQLIFFGDLFQLPPVVAHDRMMLQSKYDTPYFFGSNVFDNLNFKIVELQNTYRQKDKEFIELLDSIRTAEYDETTLKELNARVDTGFIPNNEFITLTTTNRLAGSINDRKLAEINDKSYSYLTSIEGKFNENEKLPVDKVLTLKRGAKVIFLRNDLDKKWVNGSLGTIEDIDPKNIVVRLDDGKVVDVGKEVWEKVKYSYDEEKDIIVSETTGKLTQYPLKLAWALTIHKSQGQTFDKVFIDLSTNAFSHGQTYVALSRCKTLNGIVLKTPITKRDIIVDNTIIDFLSCRQKTVNDY